MTPSPAAPPSSTLDERPDAASQLFAAAPDPDWYRDAVIYELHVRAFADSDGDGIGDFVGLTQKLDYLQDLGVTAIWLLPFYPSPMRDEGYDISDYRGVHPDVRHAAAVPALPRRGAPARPPGHHRARAQPHVRSAPVVPACAAGAAGQPLPRLVRVERRPRIATATRASSFATSSSRTGRGIRSPNQYYWHRFYAHQPDLNFDNAEVRREMLRSVEYWFEMGVDGLRLDAVPYLFEREGTTCENLPETHEFLRELRRHVDARFAERMLLAEANQWPEDAIAYFGDGDECHMAFHFPLMPRLFMGLRMEDRFPIIDILRQTPPIPDGAQWAVFLRNHDELTLEMVTDEERDYMYRDVRARPRRCASTSGSGAGSRRSCSNHRQKIELMHGLLCSLPGTPVLYYGDEIGMGDNVYLGDRDGVRTPMQWSADRNAGFSTANPQTPVPAGHHRPRVQLRDGQRRGAARQPGLVAVVGAPPHRVAQALSRVRARHRIELLSPDNHRVLAFLRREPTGAGPMTGRASRCSWSRTCRGYAQYVELDLVRVPRACARSSCSARRRSRRSASCPTC